MGHDDNISLNRSYDNLVESFKRLIEFMFRMIDDKILEINAAVRGLPDDEKHELTFAIAEWLCEKLMKFKKELENAIEIL